MVLTAIFLVINILVLTALYLDINILVFTAVYLVIHVLVVYVFIYSDTYKLEYMRAHAGPKVYFKLPLVLRNPAV